MNKQRTVIKNFKPDSYPTKIVAGVLVPGDLDANGLESGGHYAPDLDLREGHILAARRVIRQYFTPINSIQRETGSYGLKHRVENVLGYHLANGELIVAMIAEGYTFARDSINCYFNVSFGSVNTLRRLTTNQPKRVK